MTDAFERLVLQLENDPLLLDPNQLRRRLDALDRLDAFFPDIPTPAADAVSAQLHQRANAISARLETLNRNLYDALRNEIQRGICPDIFLQCIHPSPQTEQAADPATGMGYDYLDELISGVFQFSQPDAAPAPPEREMVFYQPTPARHIFHLIRIAALTADDVLVDLGSGLGHVPLLVSVCTEAGSVGVELEAGFVQSACECAHRLNLKKATFLHQDARAAVLSTGTVFYLHTPFVGSILSAVLNRLRREAANRPIRICTYGPCTAAIAQETWLVTDTSPETDRIILFRSHD